MPPTNAKNVSLTSASQDLGLGAMLQTQLEDQSEEAKKRAMAQKSLMSSGVASSNLNSMGSAAMSLGLGG